jgi:hypothetical protein
MSFLNYSLAATGVAAPAPAAARLGLTGPHAEGIGGDPADPVAAIHRRAGETSFSGPGERQTAGPHRRVAGTPF